MLRIDRAHATPGKRIASVARGLAWLAAVAVLSVPSSLAFARDPGGDQAGLVAGEGTNGRAAREAAVAAIPYENLSDEGQELVADVVSNPSIFRRMPTQVFPCDPELYLFLVNHPDVVVNIWQILGISSVAIKQTGPDTYEANDGAGTSCSIQYLVRTPQTHLIYAEGSYQGPLFKRQVKGRCVMLLKTGYIRETNGRDYVTNRLDAFLQIDRVGAEVIVKTVQPILGKTADTNFAETTAFVERLSRTAELSNPRVVKLAARLTKVEPDLRTQFATVAGSVADRAAERERDDLPARDLKEAKVPLPERVLDR